MVDDLSTRLRSLRDRKNWTVADMAERTGIPKRTLDKYMLRSDASLPGFDALCSISKGLGVSLDWLVFGADSASENVELLATRSAYEVVLMFTDGLVRQSTEAGSRVIIGDQILTLTPEEWSADIAWRAGEKARELLLTGATKEDLLIWKEQVKERLGELLSDRIASKTSKVMDKGNGN